ncbi:hypothetical protein GCM10027162_71380 [Streptomyces incanus]
MVDTEVVDLCGPAEGEAFARGEPEWCAAVSCTPRGGRRYDDDAVQGASPRSDGAPRRTGATHQGRVGGDTAPARDGPEVAPGGTGTAAEPIQRRDWFSTGAG